MSVPKKRKLNDEEMISVLNDLSETDSVSEIDDSDNNSSESLESCDVSSDDDAIALPSDWSTQGRERDPFNFSGQSGVQFTVHNSEEPLEFFEKFLMMRFLNIYALKQIVLPRNILMKNIPWQNDLFQCFVCCSLFS